MAEWFVLNHMAAQNWMKSLPTTCFAIYGFSKAIPRRPVMVSEGFQRGLKPCGVRAVSEGSETVWFQRGFRGVWNRLVSDGFQRGLKPCGFRGVSEGSETVWFQTGFIGVWNRVVSEEFQRGLKPFFFKRRFRNVCMIFFESYGDLKLDELGPRWPVLLQTASPRSP